MDKVIWSKVLKAFDGSFYASDINDMSENFHFVEENDVIHLRASRLSNK